MFLCQYHLHLTFFPQPVGSLLWHVMAFIELIRAAFTIYPKLQAPTAATKIHVSGVACFVSKSACCVVLLEA